MTRSRYRIFETEYPYFMTCTIVGWLPVFTRPEAVDIVYDSWRHSQRERGLKLFGYVILENHLHLIASAPDLSDVMQRFKSFTARQIVDMAGIQGRAIAAVGSFSAQAAAQDREPAPGVGGREPSPADPNGRDDVAETGVRPRQPGPPRICR